MPQFRVEKKMPAVSSRKKMPAISRREICRLFRAGKNVRKLGPEKNAINIRSEQNVGKFEPEKNSDKFGRKKKCRCFWAEKIAWKTAIASELRGLLKKKQKKNGIPEKPEQVPSLLKIEKILAILIFKKVVYLPFNLRQYSIYKSLSNIIAS